MDADEALADAIYESVVAIADTRLLPVETRLRLDTYSFAPVAFTESGSFFAVMVLVNRVGVCNCEVHMLHRHTPTEHWEVYGEAGTEWPTADLRPLTQAEIGAVIATLGFCQLDVGGDSGAFTYGLVADSQASAMVRLDDGSSRSVTPMMYGAWVIGLTPLGGSGSSAPT